VCMVIVSQALVPVLNSTTKPPSVHTFKKYRSYSAALISYLDCHYTHIT
jgi:hypothetical protein